MSDEVLVQSRKLRGGHLAVVFPPDGLLRLVVTDNILVFWAAAGVRAGFSAQRAARCDLRFTVLEGAFVQFGFKEVPVQPFETLFASPKNASIIFTYGKRLSPDAELWLWKISPSR